MSVINKMLRDLDERHALAAPESAPTSVQSGPEAHRRRDREWFWRIVSALMLVAVAWVGWIAYQLQPQPLVTDLALRSADMAHRAAAQKATGATAAPAQAVPGPAVPPPTPTEPPQATAVSAPSPMAAAAPTSPPDSPAGATPVAAPVTVSSPPSAQAAAAPAPSGTAKSRDRPAKASAVAARGDPERRAGTEAGSSPAGQKASPEAVPRLAPEVPAARILSAPAAKARIEKRDTVRTPSQRAELEFRQGVGHLREGRPGDAESHFEKALEAYPAHEAARQAYVALLIDRRAYSQALVLLEQGLAQNPGQPLFSLFLARLRVDEGAFARALEVLDASRGGAEYAEIQALRGTVLHRLGRHALAADAYRAALHLAPRDGGSWIGLALSLEALQKLPEAAEAFRRAAASGTLSPEMKANAERRARQIQ